MIKRSPQDEKRVTKIKVLQRGGGGWGGSLQKVLWQEDVSPVLCAWNPTEAVFVLLCSKKKRRKVCERSISHASFRCCVAC